MLEMIVHEYINNDQKYWIDRNFCSVHEEITSIRLYTRVTQGCVQPG